MIRDLVLRSGSLQYDTDAVSVETGLLCEDVSLAVQSSKEEADINVLVKRFGLTGQLPQGVIAPTFGDFGEVFDFHSAMNVIAQANEAFDAMPAEVRYRFQNDPGRFLEFVQDANNREEAIRLGIANAPPAPPVGESSPAVAQVAASAPAV